MITGITTTALLALVVLEIAWQAYLEHSPRSHKQNIDAIDRWFADAEERIDRWFDRARSRLNIND